MGGTNKASKAAAAQNAAQQQQITDSTNAINNIFNDPTRTAQYKKLGSDTTAYYQQQLDNQQAINNRNLTFAQARNGQTGSSVAADQATQAGKDYDAGTLDAERRGQAATASLQSQDETERSNLEAAAQGGLTATQAASEGASALQSNLNSAQSNATANAFGDTFGDFATIYQKSQDAAALRNGYQYAGTSIYSPKFGYGAGTSSQSTPYVG